MRFARWIPAFAGMTMIMGAAHAADLQSVRSITVNGMAERAVVPDEAHVTVNLNAMEKTIGAAKKAHDAKLQKLMGIVSKAGIDEKKVRSQYSNTQPVYHYEEVNHKNKRVLDGYRVQTNLDITVAETAKLAELMDTVSNAGFEDGANPEWGWGDLMSVNYEVSNPDKVRDAMLTDAIGNAHNKAEQMAGAAGAKLGHVLQVNEGSSPQFNFPRPMAMMARASLPEAAAPMAPPAGEQKLQSTVTVMYELKD